MMNIQREVKTIAVTTATIVPKVKNNQRNKNQQTMMIVPRTNFTASIVVSMTKATKMKTI